MACTALLKNRRGELLNKEEYGLVQNNAYCFFSKEAPHYYNTPLKVNDRETQLKKSCCKEFADRYPEKTKELELLVDDAFELHSYGISLLRAVFPVPPQLYKPLIDILYEVYLYCREKGVGLFS